ncbi:DUF6976 family protein [Phaeovulum vinaykumarii]|uniref:Uncharacterized protein n=1 Tax=Phaeovulum vinaykumarii TaxID=407234 RepID=A0A1N7JIW9_9RHOB|nr:hypothetical protein [Phaeovulum vinaykumarii]SIS49268.1 hypothetical protein SAMN05421795_10130 [Phaeovulum vinaykumarii]SOB89518.1 hypothetical protein SAMN05878426_10130 [Phaeovulum vinaykumarii]
MKNEMLSVPEVSARIREGAVMVIAGDETLLAQLPRGAWIGGTTVYFVTDTGGAVVRDRLFVTTFAEASGATPRYLPHGSLSHIADGYVTGGFTMIMIPAFSLAHSEFAVAGQEYPGLFDQPLAGWVTGVHLDEIGTRAPKVFDGATGMAHDEGVVLLHVALPEGRMVDLDILNIFAQGDNADLSFTFPESGFSTRKATVNGAEVDFAAYVAQNGIDTRLPLVANYAGALVNVSIRDVNPDTGEVSFYAPVVAGVEYRLAGALGNYAEAFAEGAEGKGEGQYSCNCILNYLYGDLEGKRTGSFTGPVTFGEIAYILLNQTLVRLDINKAA